MARRGRSVAIVGEGLVGSVLALTLARRGFEVEVYERRPDPRKAGERGGRSINLALSTRGLNALRGIGLEDAALRRAIPMVGRMVHPLRRAANLQLYGKDESQHINSISRAGLNSLLIDQAARSRRIRLHFSSNVLGLDFRTGVLRVRSEDTGRVSEVRTSVVLGADGSASALRRDMAARPGFDCSQRRLGHGYKELTLPAGPRGRHRLAKNALHIWPRGTYMLIALPNLDGSFTLTLFLPFKGPASFASLSGPRAATAFMRAQFPDAARLIPDLARQFFANPTGVMATVKCRPWSVEDRALLLGDAAHAIVPFFGQGMNCGFEDCTALGECLDAVPASRGWRPVFERFTALRKPNADAIADMAVENFIEMRDKVADPRFVLRRKVEHILEGRFPGRYVPRYELVTFSRVPYALARRAGEVQSRILGRLCAGLRDPEAVDLGKARALIERHLAPVMQGADL